MESPSEALPRPTGLPAALSLQPPEATAVNPQLSFLEDGGHVYWFLYLQVCDCYLQGDRLARALLGAVPDVEPGDSGGIGAGAGDQRAHGDARAAADAAGGGVELRAAAAAAAAARDRGPGGAGAGGGAAARGREPAWRGAGVGAVLRDAAPVQARGLAAGDRGAAGERAGSGCRSGSGPLRDGRELGGRRSRGCWRGLPFTHKSCSCAASDGVCCVGRDGDSVRRLARWWPAGCSLPTGLGGPGPHSACA